MPRLPLLLLTYFTILLSAQADYQTRSKGLELYKAENYPAALEIFLTLSKTKSDIQQAEALLLAARTAERMGDSTQAMALAESIRLEPFRQFTKATLLKEKKEWAEVLLVSESVDPAKWPEKLISPTYTMRGEAFLSLGKCQDAQAAFAEAAKYTVSPLEKSRALLAGAEAAQKAGQLPDQLLDLYQEVVTLAPRGGGILPRAHVARAKILATQGKEQAALNEIVPVEEFGKKDVYWTVAAQLAYGEIYETTGKPEQAKIHFQKACDIPQAPADLVKQAKEGLSRLK